MGQTGQKPIIEKQPEDGRDVAKGMAWGCNCMQGWRTSMEDAHLAMSSVGEKNGWADVALFGVMDGHGGEHVARFCERHLPRTIAEGRSEAADCIGEAMTSAFHRMDDMLREPEGLAELRTLGNRSTALSSPLSTQRQPHPDHVGCTAVLCCMTGQALITANSGDSRAVLCRGGKAVALSEDHKPNDPIERSRITKAGGWVQAQPGVAGTQYRVNGNLNLSRAIGDLEYKKGVTLKPQEQIISATPDIRVELRQQDDEFVILACDGVWDVMTNQEAVDFVRPRLPAARGNRAGLSGIGADLLDKCCSPNLAQTQGLGGDNMTVVIVQFRDFVEAELLQMERREQRLFVEFKLPPGIDGGKDLELDVAERVLRLRSVVNGLNAVSDLAEVALLEDVDVDLCVQGGAISRFVRSKQKLKVWLALKEREDHSL